jgi:ABC-type sugar transport system ATPase subunit
MPKVMNPSSPEVVSGPSTDSADRLPVLEARNVAKRFGATRALVDGNFAVHQGEVVALLGENGSGKSTLVKLLSGVLRPDEGGVWIDGVPSEIQSPRAALNRGIVTVFQEILVAPDRSVLENLWLGNGTAAYTRGRYRDRRARAELVLAELDPDFPSLDSAVHELDLMQRQVCVIARALLREPRVLILDESTSTLDVTLRDRFFGVLRKRCATGMAAVFISHRMDEVLDLADRFVALRSGRTVGELGRENVSANALFAMISGESELVPATSSDLGEPRERESAIRLTRVVLRPGSLPLDLEIGRGEIIGLAGLEGHGQDELLRAMAALHTVASGTIEQNRRGKIQRFRSYRDAVASGVAYVPRDRKIDGIADVLSVTDNYALPTFRRDSIGSFIRFGRTRARMRRESQTVNFTASPGAAAGRLSGGNQQKLILARWLATEPEVLLLNDPTRGVDLRTKRELYALFKDLARSAVTIVMLSTEVDELISLCDRVVVFHAGSCSAVLSGKQITRENLVASYFGNSPIPRTEDAA